MNNPLQVRGKLVIQAAAPKWAEFYPVDIQSHGVLGIKKDIQER